MAKKKVKKKRAAVKTKKKKPAAGKKRKQTKTKRAVNKTSKAASPRKKTARRKATSTKKASSGRKRAAPARPRPKIPGNAKLYLVFKEDFPARQIFTFLRVETVKELEAFRADEIIARLTAPVVSTVERIRQRLAENNRYLAGDEKLPGGGLS